jgi:glycogen debranching enzyme
VAAPDPGPDRVPGIEAADPWVGLLADQLHLGLVRRGRRLTLIASLPGGEERVEQTARAIPGLLAFRGFDAAREILRGLFEYLDEGLAPESFDRDRGTPIYGAAEPALWLAIVGELYGRRSGDTEFEKGELERALDAITHAYRSGTRTAVRLDRDGLLAEGRRGARSPGLNALWYHASIAIARLARRIGHRENAAFHLAWANEHQKRVNEILWDEDHGCLLEDGNSFGPAQVFAVSLAPSLLPLDRARRLLDRIERELFTPFGLRASPDAPIATTAWLGPFHAAYLRAHARSAEAQARSRGWLETLRRHLDESGLSSLPEAFEVGAGSAPAPRPAAMGEPLSVLAAADLARFWIEDLEPAGNPAPALA